MLFNSWQFAIFFPLVTLAYFALPHRARWLLLLAASCVFYMAFVPAYILILVGTILVDYAAGLLIARSTAHRRLWLGASLAANLGVLAAFKYFNFANENLAALAGFLHWNYPLQALHLLLPIGLSFHVFQSLSYTIEVYRGNVPPERHLGIFALYVMFYPQLVAGPIERPQNLLHQFREPHAFDAERVTQGLLRMGWGLFKKVVVADRLALVASPVFAAPHQYTGLPLIAAVLFLTIQIYCDFSGYSDIALGSARVMGFTLMENFKQPYGSRSVAEFWTRWHVSLSTWFRDYVYIPLGGNRAHWARNVIVVFLLSGLWHGANWTFVVWGGLHAGYMLIERALGSWRARLPQVLQVGLTFAAVAFAWIFFRANTLADAAYVAGHLVAGLGAQLKSPGAAWAALAAVPVEAAQWPLALAAIAVLELVQLALRRGASWTWLVAQPAWVRWPVYQMLAWAIVLFGTFENRAFIYFQF